MKTIMLFRFLAYFIFRILDEDSAGKIGVLY